MSTDPSGAPGGLGAGPGGASGQPSEEELRAAYEAELSRITSADMMLQASVSLLNIGSYRLSAPPPPGAEPQAGRDLEQVRDAIDGVRGLMEILERRLPAGELGPLRNALSQLQMAYAREMHGAGAGPPTDAAPGGDAAQSPGEAPPAAGASGGKPGEGDASGDQGSPGPGPAESSGRLWVPGR